MLIGQRALRSLVLLVTAVVLALGSMVVTPSLASAATSSVNGTLTTAQPTYKHNVVRASDNYPCAAGTETTHYRVFSARVVGSAATTLSATVSPTGFRANLGTYDGSFQPAAPVVNCMGDTAGSASGAPVTYSITTQTQPAGVTERTYVFVVAGYSADDLGSFTLSVTSTTGSLVAITDITPAPPSDTTKPVLSGMNDVTREATSSAGAAVTFAPTANDAVDGPRPVTCSPVSGSTFAIGTTPVTCSATDASNNKATGTFDVMVRDTTKPVLSGLSTITEEAAGPSGNAVTYAVPTASDTVDGARPVSCEPAPGSTFAIKTTAVTCSASDTRGNTSTATFDLIVEDTTKPTVTVPTDMRVQATSSAGATVAFEATASDSGSGLVSPTPSCTPARGASFPIGTTTVTCTAADKAGHQASNSFDVTVYKGTLGVTGSIVIDGTAKVGGTLTATSTVVTSPTSTTSSRQWLRGGNPIASATGSTYQLTAADLGKTITHRQTDSVGGYDDAVSTSNAVGPVAEGDLILGKPAISGTAQVGKTLTVVPGTVSPTDAEQTYEWFAGATSLGTGTTYVVKPADLSSTIRVTATATKTAYAPATATSDTSSAVVAGTLTTTGGVTVTGSAKVGSTLAAVTTVQTTPSSASPTGQWFRGTVPIAGADQTTYVPTNEDAGSVLTYAETRTLTGYTTVVTTTAPTSVVSGGVITVGKPVVTGDAVVDRVLNVSVSGPAPADATTSFTWFVGETQAGTGNSYTVKPDDVGSAIKAVASTSKPFFDTVTGTSEPTNAVQQAAFVTGPSAAITGVFRVGEELTAETGTLSPAADSFTYAWFADDAPIADATGATFTVTPPQKGKRISVKVTAVRAGYVSASDTSERSAAVVTHLAPGLSLTPSVTELRLGQSTTLTWTSVDAISVVASSGWSGAKASSGSEVVTPSSVGTPTYVLTATNGAGTTTAQVAVPVALAPARLALTAKSSVRADKLLAVKASGLAPSEPYTLRLGGKVVASGQATSAGRITRSVRVPSSVKAGSRVLRLTGSLADRTASRTVKVVRVKALKLVLADSSVRASDRQRVTVSRLLPGERVAVTYQGKRISAKSARANRKGVFTMSFDVDVTWGRKTVTATGATGERSASRTFSVVNRCPQGGYYCR